MIIKNAKNTKDLTPPSFYSSWLEYWESHKKFSLFCSCKDCNNLAEVGGHVQKIYQNDKKLYIVPLCQKCNSKTGTFEVSEEDLVEAPK